ncbi:MAG: type II toxin-antitoxin system VapC family toxin [Vulcanimicrobiaceae bacterium]
MTTASRPRSPEISGPLYLDASAAVKLYVPEKESAALNSALRGRRDALISDLAITEIVSSLARRFREGGVARDAIGRLHSELLGHVESGFYRRIDLTPEVHREAERLLRSLDGVALRAADALHLSLALSAGSRSLVTFDRRLAEATRAVGLRAFP